MNNVFSRGNEAGRKLRMFPMPVSAIAASLAALGVAVAAVSSTRADETVSFDTLRDEIIISRGEYALGVEYGMLESGEVLSQDTADAMQRLDALIRPLVTPNMKSLADTSWSMGVVNAIQREWTSEDLGRLASGILEVDDVIEDLALETFKEMRNKNTPAVQALVSVGAAMFAGLNDSVATKTRLNFSLPDAGVSGESSVASMVRTLQSISYEDEITARDRQPGNQEMSAEIVQTAFGF